MPLTAAQARQSNLVNSLKDWITTTIINPYNAEVVSSDHPTPCAIQIAKPDDPGVYANVPVILINIPILDAKPAYGTGCGDGLVWKCKRVWLSVYPGTTLEGKPSVQAQDDLASLFDSGLATALYIPINDYRTGTPVLIEAMRVVDPTMVMPQGRVDENLAIDRHRFDYKLDLEYTQVAPNG